MDENIKTDIHGLSMEEAASRLKKYGFNEIQSQKKISPLATAKKLLSEPMIILLFLSTLMYFFLGELKDAVFLAMSMLSITLITFYQERKTENALQALKDLSSPRASVIRDGVQIKIPGREVVAGDIIIVREGDRIPADATVVDCENLTVNESLLTGESMAVRKSEWDGKLKEIRPGGEDLPFIYSSTLVISGRGTAKVTSIGADTQVGKIGKSLELIKQEDSLLKKETTKIVKDIAVVGVIVCVILVLIYVFLRGDVSGGILAGLTLSMAILPEEFPLVLIVFLVLGAWRMSKKKVLTRNPSSIETLGAATVLCTDKTGTLTLNKTVLHEIYTEGGFFDFDKFKKSAFAEKFHILMEYAVLASQKDQFDPIEKELNFKTGKFLKNTRHIHENWELKKEYPLTKELFALSHVWKSRSSDDYVIASKGAPEAIIDLCHLPGKQAADILKVVEQMSVKGMRVLAVAKAIFTKEKLPSEQHDFDFNFVGLLGFLDPIRETVPASVREAYRAGMRVIVMTGDYPGTAQHVAKEVGIKNWQEFITGDDIAKMSKEELKEVITRINVFARIVPEQKLNIVNALKANGEIVAMTGDGVNDSPALKAAHIGIAMGERGTDVAREASSLVLLDDNFSSILVAIRMGRRIYENLKNAMGYLLAIHVPIAGMSLLPVMFNLPIVLLPAHITFLEFVIDPSCSLVFESAKSERGIMKNKPRKIDQKLFSKGLVIIKLLQGFGILMIVFALFIYVKNSGRSEEEIRAFAFSALVISNLALIVSSVSWTENLLFIIKNANRTLWLILLMTLLGLSAVIYIPFFADLFHLTFLNIQDLILVMFSGMLALVWFEMLKYFLAFYKKRVYT